MSTTKVKKKEEKPLSKFTFKIPSRSHDLSHIKNIFNLTVKCFREVAIKNTTHKTFNEFSARVERTLKTSPVDIINRTIDSIPRRVNMVLESNGMRIKYQLCFLPLRLMC